MFCATAVALPEAVTIAAHGPDAPPAPAADSPKTSFAELGLMPELLRAVAEEGYL